MQVTDGKAHLAQESKAKPKWFLGPERPPNRRPLLDDSLCRVEYSMARRQEHPALRVSEECCDCALSRFGSHRACVSEAAHHAGRFGREGELRDEAARALRRRVVALLSEERAQQLERGRGAERVRVRSHDE
eukprot:2493914-Pleurochrysis_carterae.AAC.1